jgi:hypothetical protein
MSPTADHTATARTIVDSNLYMVLGTADADGHPWVSPVYFASVGYSTFLWVSRPERQHSRNVAVRPEVSLVIFDSTTPISTGLAVYVAGVADEVPSDDVPPLIDAYSRRAVGHGGSPWVASAVRSPAPHRLYRATATQTWALDELDNRIAVTLGGR